MIINLELIERFHEKWELSDNGCWEWTGALMGKGYGFLKIPGTRKQIGAHRLSFLIHHGPLPDDALVCHTCDNPKCVKPSHLFAGSASDNLQDMKHKDRHLNGARNGQAKLTDDKVRQIHRMNRKGLSQGKIAKSFGIAQSTVFKILNGQRWEHIYREMFARAGINDPG
jgi:DNA-binding CsgD family transcriptional regulator